MRRTPLERMLPLSAVLLLGSSCDGRVSWGPPPPDDAEWEWTNLSGPDALTPELVANHETLVVAGDDLLLGTADGVWRRPLADDASWQRTGLEGRAIHALTKTADGARVIAAGYDPRDERAPTVWYSTTGGLDWIAAAEWPRRAAGSADAGVAFRFASLEPDPHDVAVVYGGLDADSIAVTVDGGATWIMANGATSPNFGYPCVAQRPGNASVLLQGCELPLDVAWVGARDVDEDDRFSLPEFRFLFGYPDMDELGNRRINSMAAVSGRDDRVLVGVEGGLVELTSDDDAWRERDELAVRWYYRSDGSDAASRPYVYVRAIAALGADGRHALFGGTLNGTNDELMLFETSNGGGSVRRIRPPFELDDPRVEQAVPLAADDVLLAISSLDEQDRRKPRVFRLRRTP